MIRAVLHARASQHARCLGPSYQGQSQLGAEGNIDVLALKGDSGTIGKRLLARARVGNFVA